MKHSILYIFIFALSFFSQAQREFHATVNGTPNGNGTMQKPWDLQTALSQKPDVVNGNDTIWIHGGIYNGRYSSTLKSTKTNKYITVAPYNNEKVILNGNVDSKKGAVLNVTSTQVIFRDFEITWLGKFSRNEVDLDFRNSAGIYHTSGENCKFYNLIIHDNPGLGFGSWKQTGGTIIENCVIYFNGWVAKNGKGRGEGMYVQNTKDNTRIIKNNIIFANYYKGIEVWSAGRNKDFQFVKNINLEHNIIFNSGTPSGNSYDNLIIATDDRNGINIAKNINVLNNVLYHNTDYLNREVNGDAPSLTLGYTKNSPVEDIVVKNNIILGRNNVLRLLHVKTAIFENNTVYGGYVFLNANEMHYSNNWTFNNNTYFTKKVSAFRVHQDKTYPLKEWQSQFKLDKDSQWHHIKDFDLKNVLAVNQHSQRKNVFNVALFNKQGNDVEVDFSDYKISYGTSYKIYDIENREVLAAQGIIGKNLKILFPMGKVDFIKPLSNDITQKTLSNFGVFVIEFESKRM